MYSLHLARHGPSFIKKFLLLFLASFVAFIVMCVCLLIPPLGAYAHLFMTLVTSIVFFLKLAVFWVFAFQYWVTASNFDEIMEQVGSGVKARSGLTSSKQIHRVFFVGYLIVAGLIIFTWMLVGFILEPKVPSS